MNGKKKKSNIAHNMQPLNHGNAEKRRKNNCGFAIQIWSQTISE